MKTYFRTVAAAVVIAGAGLALAASTGSVSLSAFQGKPRLHITKQCTQYNGAAGGFCTLASSNLGEIPAGSTVFYDQAAGIPEGLLDSNVVLEAGNGNRALGRCTLDFATSAGVCTFSDGTGNLAGFHARVDISFLGMVQGVPTWAWDGTYNFSREPGGDR